MCVLVSVCVIMLTLQQTDKPSDSLVCYNDKLLCKERERESLTVQFCEKSSADCAHTHTHSHICKCIFVATVAVTKSIYCMCVCVFVPFVFV